MKLSSLLITPIQRIPRYCLLLKQILVYTTEQEDDYQILKGTYYNSVIIIYQTNILIRVINNQDK